MNRLDYQSYKQWKNNAFRHNSRLNNYYCAQARNLPRPAIANDFGYRSQDLQFLMCNAKDINVKKAVKREILKKLIPLKMKRSRPDAFYQLKHDKGLGEIRNKTQRSVLHRTSNFAPTKMTVKSTLPSSAFRHLICGLQGSTEGRFLFEGRRCTAAHILARLNSHSHIRKLHPSGFYVVS
ncbi:unnamed protein product [Dicrocoelium dendriticum]|nr:unnamed protein product [Dicrocoelium dendriticum]